MGGRRLGRQLRRGGTRKGGDYRDPGLAWAEKPPRAPEWAVATLEIQVREWERETKASVPAERV